jgi:predicted cupin superfamily sugar epimerase
MLEADEIRRRLGLEPHPAEGGYFAETYRSSESLPPGAGPSGARPLATAIYYLITPRAFSEMHRLASDEIFHFYLGDPVQMLLLAPDGTGRVVVLGTDLEAGMRPQVVVPRGVWQGSRLVPGGRAALLGTTVSPGFTPADYEPGVRGALAKSHPAFRDLVHALTR